MDLPDEKEYDFKEVIMTYTGKKIRKQINQVGQSVRISKSDSLNTF